MLGVVHVSGVDKLLTPEQMMSLRQAFVACYHHTECHSWGLIQGIIQKDVRAAAIVRNLATNSVKNARESLIYCCTRMIIYVICTCC